MIAANAFLEALDLPAEHPYATQQNSTTVNVKEDWSMASYFSTVSWNNDQQTTATSSEANECGNEFLSPSWFKSMSRPEKTAQELNYAAVNSSYNEVGFLEEVRPCLVSMFKMNIIIWAPLVLLFCLKKLYFHRSSHHHHHLEHEGISSVSSSMQSNPKQSYFITNIPSLPSYVPSLRRAAGAHDKKRRQAPRPYQNTSFERLLLFLSLFLNAISVMASFSAIFAVEEKKKEAKSKAATQEEEEEVKPRRQYMSSELFKRYHQFMSTDSIGSVLTGGPFVITSDWLAYGVALLVTSFIMNDALYVLEFSQHNMIALHLFIISVALKRFGSKVSVMTALPITIVALYIMAHQDLDLPTIQPGLYYDETNPLISEAVQGWPIDKYTYDDGRGTPWLMTGDVRTGIPFTIIKIPEQNYVRRWVPLPEEKEAVILDIAFPESMEIGDDKVVYLVLHGINGDSNEGYVVDFVHRQVSLGNIVAVMTTRGLGDSPILGDNILHFARTSDVKAAAKALKKAIQQVSPRNENKLLFAGVGYSMGAITLANFASDPDCDLDVAVAFSGALDTKQQAYFERSASLWQPFIAKAMRDTLLSKYSEQIRRKFDQEQFRKIMTASSLVELDKEFFARYHGFDSLDDYYSQMGAMADFDKNGYEGRISDVSIPLLCIQSLDDPIGYWKTFHDPTKVSHSGKGNIMLLFTQTGGHVGWPLGWNPGAEGWSWMSDAASSFVESFDRARRKD